MTIKSYESGDVIDNAEQTQRFVRETDIQDIISKAIIMNFEMRANDAATYVAVDNTLRLLKHEVEDLFNA